jgi:hypothetical protein
MNKEYIITDSCMTLTHLGYSYISNITEIEDYLYKEKLTRINPTFKVDNCKTLWIDLDKTVHYDYNWIFKDRFVKIGNDALQKSKQLLKTFSQITGENFKFAFRRYLYPKISSFRIIEYSEWKFLPHYIPNDAIKKLNLSVLYNLYNKSK